MGVGADSIFCLNAIRTFIEQMFYCFSTIVYMRSGINQKTHFPTLSRQSPIILVALGRIAVIVVAVAL